MSAFFWSNLNQNVKNINKHMILDLIRFTPGGISRVEIARRVGLTRAAVTEGAAPTLVLERKRKSA